jgi:diguanylate cyclase (GGDEF)-like protein
MKFGLRVRLGVLLAAFGVLATGVTGWYAYQQARELLVQAAERDLMGATQMFSRRVSAIFARIAGDTRMLAQWDLSRQVTAAAVPSRQMQDALADAFARLLDNNPRYLQVRLIGARDHGLELVRVDRTRAGTVRVEGDLLQEKAHFPYVFETLKLHRGGVFMSQIGLDHESGSHAAFNQPMLDVACPVYAGGSQPVGVLVVGVDVSRVFGDLQADIPSYLHLLLANEWGDFLIHPDASQAFAFEQGRRARIQDAFPQVEPLLKGGEAPTLAQGPLTEGRNEVQVLGAFMRLSLVPDEVDDDVLLGIAEPLPAIVHATRDLTRNVASLVIGLSVAAILLALLAARVVTRPLKQMTRQVQRFSRERLIGPLPTRRRDEIGELARGFAHMQERVLDAMSELQASRERLADRARRDPLTGLHNRAGFAERLEHAIATARRGDHAVGLLFIDLDRFKQVNDRHGHAVGDLVLQGTAQRLAGSVRESDTVGRLGGDEFVVLLEGIAGEHDAVHVAQTLVQRFQEPVMAGELALEVRISIGISLFPRDGDDVKSLLERADQAMYLSKSGAGNRYSVFGDIDDSPPPATTARNPR